jgi:hypothetical protein
MEALTMEDSVDSWNDDRLDELSRRMDNGFKEINERFDRLLHTLALIAWGFTGTTVAALAGVLVAALS